MVKRTVAARNPLLVVVGLVAGVAAIYMGVRQVASGLNEMGSGSSLVSQIETASVAALKEMKAFDGAPSVALDYPADWEVAPVNPPFALQASTLKGTINFSLIHQVMSGKESVTLEQFTAINVEEIKNMDQPGLKFERIHSSENVTVNGILVVKTLFGTVITSGEKPVQVRQLMATFIVNQDAFILTCSVSDGGYDAASRVFDAIIGSIRRK